jgi:nucleotide-binding universal stress UspA family protein
MFERIVVGTDGSSTAGRAVRQALRLAKLTGGTVHVVTAWQSVPALAAAGPMAAMPVAVDDGAWAATLHRDVEEQAATHGVPVLSHAVQGTPAQVLLEVARDVEADLLVVGNVGMHGIRGHLASVPNTVAHKAPCAVLVVPTA